MLSNFVASLRTFSYAHVLTPFMKAAITSPAPSRPIRLIKLLAVAATFVLAYRLVHVVPLQWENLSWEAIGDLGLILALGAVARQMLVGIGRHFQRYAKDISKTTLIAIQSVIAIAAFGLVLFPVAWTYIEMVYHTAPLASKLLQPALLWGFAFMGIWSVSLYSLASYKPQWIKFRRYRTRVAV